MSRNPGGLRDVKGIAKNWGGLRQALGGSDGKVPTSVYRDGKVSVQMCRYYRAMKCFQGNRILLSTEKPPLKTPRIPSLFHA